MTTLESSPPPTPECDKLAKRTEEWNVIYPFIEHLYEKRMTLAEWRDAKKMFKEEQEEAKETETEFKYKTLEDFKFWHSFLLEQPVPMRLNQLDDLLYEYFGVDPVKLEQERRQLLEYMRNLQKQRREAC